MRLPFGRRSVPPLQAAADRLHDALIDRVRQPIFYTDYGVPDTFEGRFDLLVLHAGLVLRRLREVGPDGLALGQALVDLMFTRFDVAMRELGVSDIGVPKRMKRLAEAFKGRTAVYDAALARSDAPALAAAVSRNVLGGGDGEPLARYAAAVSASLADAPLERLWDGRPPLPEPARQTEARP
jgi:cytochrome b pre-mRNA-processing protein 3